MIGRRQGLRRVRSRVGSRISAPEMLESRQLLATFSVTNTADTGAGSLRAAITSANQSAGSDRIVFNIVGAGVQTIQLATPLPPVVDTLEIDGTTQPGYAGTPRVALDGTNAGISSPGLQLQAATTVKGLAVTNFGAEGIRVQASGSKIQTSYIGIDPAGGFAAPNVSGIVVSAGSGAIIGGDGLGNVISGNRSYGVRVEGSGTSGTRIQGNLIGTSPDGNFAVPNSLDGVNVTFAGGVLIGGLNPGERNIISGNGIRGISTFQSQTPNTIQNNYIGTNLLGTAALPNGGDGIQLFSPGDTVGGLVPEARNVISGNQGKGIQLFSANQSIIQGNWIGVAADGVTAVGNEDAGIGIQGSNNVLIGGSQPGAGNIIAYNGSPFFEQGGINIFSGNRNTIRTNQIYDNTGRGIRFFTVDGLPPGNDPGDADSGPNNLQNYPQLALAGTGNGRTRIRGALNSAPNTTFVLEFFSNAAPDPSGNGEGQTPIGTVTVVTNSSGTALLDLTLPEPAAVGSYITATATDPAGNTSEFSNAVPVSASTVVDLAVARVGLGGGTTDTGTLGQPLTYTVTATNNGPGSASDVELLDIVPAGFTIQSITLTGNGTYNQTGNIITANLPVLAAGEQATLTVTVVPNSVGQFTSTVSISSLEEIDSDTSNNSTTWTTAVSQPVDLEVEVQADLQPGQPGALITDPITYFVGVVNSNLNVPGVGTASGVKLNIELSPDVIILASSTGQGSISQVGNTLIVTFATLPVGTPAAVLIIVQPTQAGTTSITATATANETDPNPVDNVAMLNVPVLPATDLALVMSANTTEVLAGQQVTFTLHAQNNGPSNATGVVVVNDLPSGLSFVNVTSSKGTTSHNGQQVTADIGDLAFGEVATIQIVAVATYTGNATNTASISSDIADQDETNNTAVVDLTLDPADIGISVATSPVNPVSGQTLSYFLSVVNQGPATATDVVITDTISPLVTFQSATINGISIGAPVNGVLTVTLASLAPFIPATVRIDVIPNVGGVISNFATVTATQADPHPDDNTASTVSVVNAADIAVQISGPVGTISQGTPQTYRVTVRNNGPQTASHFTVEAGVPAEADFLSATAGANVTNVAQVGDTVAALIGSLGSGQTAVFTFVLRPNSVGTLTVPASYNPTATDHVDINPENNSSSVSNTVVNLPGVIQFSQSVFHTNDNAGSLSVKVVRTGGTQGTLTANYRTVGGTAVANVNFKPVSGTLTFNDGEFEKTITIPILSDGKVTGTKTFSLVLEGSALGAQKTAQVQMTETDVDLTGPQVTNIQLVGANAVTGYILTFNEQLAVGPAQMLSNYVVYLGSNPNRPVAARSAVYNDAARTVTVTLASPLPAGTFHTIVVNGTAPRGLTDRFGNLLDGNADGKNGGNFVTSYARARNLTYTDGNGDRVNLNLSGPGTIEILRNGSGDAQLVRLPGGNTRSILSGTVRRQNGRGDGMTNLGQVENLGAFQGGVRSRLTSPPFYAENTPALMPGAAARALAASRAALRRALRLR